MNVLIVSNARSGVSDTSQEVNTCIDELRASHTLTELTIEEALETATLTHAIEQNAPSTVVAIGGDGTVNLCVNIALTHNLTLAVIPVGTFNHFAKHMDIPRSVPESFALLAQNNSTLIDVGFVNDTPFVNFASIGFYADLINTREKLQKQGVKKWLGFLRALFGARYFPSRLRIEVNESKTNELRTAMIFVGNDVFNFGSLDMLDSREDIDSGKLQLVVLKDYGRVRLFLIAFLSLFVDMKNKLGFNSVLLSSFTVSPKHTKRKTVVIDGEVMKLKAPFVFSKQYQALRVICPSTK